MGIPGRRIDKEWPPDKVIELMHNHGGIIKNVAKEMGCAIKTLYDLMEVYPEIREAQRVADNRLDRHTVETYYEKLDEIAGMTVDEPAVALNAIKLALTKSKNSRYYEEKAKKEEVASISPAQLASLAAENASLRAKLESLESKN